MNVVWNDDERMYIRKHAASMTDAEIAEELSRKTGRKVTLQGARRQRQRMGIRKMQGRGVCKLVP
jgi:hypothetical protein